MGADTIKLQRLAWTKLVQIASLTIGSVLQVAAVYALPKLIPSSPREPWEKQARCPEADEGPAHVPLLPTDPEEAQATHQWLTSMGLPEQDIVGRGRLAS